MDMLVPAAWWLIGFLGAIGARYFLVSNPGQDRRSPPLTWGGAIGCTFAGVLGPITLAIAFIWFLCWLCEYSKFKDNFLNRPVFRRRD